MRKLILLSSLFFCSAICCGQPGTLDPTFGTNGLVKADLGALFNYNSSGNQVIVQPGGTMYMVIETNGTTIVAKKKADGSPDSSYGKNGYSVPVPVTGSYGAMQADGKIIIAGIVVNNRIEGDGTDFAIARLNIDGSLDKTFNGTGIQITDLGQTEHMAAVVIQPDGKIVAAGNTLDVQANSNIVLTRYNTDGSFDDTFNGGIVETDFGTSQVANSIVLQNDGKILVVGGIMPIPNTDYTSEIIRYNSNGSLDLGFNGTGSEIFNNAALLQSIALQNDGKIIATNNFSLVRFKSDGSIDSTFDGDGIQTINFGTDAHVNSIVLQADGKIVLAGSARDTDTSHYHFEVARYNSDGSPDITFDGDGKLTTDFGTSGVYANSIAIQTDGRLVAIGNTGNSEVAAARYNTDGSLDNTFDSGGLFIERPNHGNTHYTSTVVQTDGKIIAAGSTWNGSNYDFALAHYNPDGTLDKPFWSNGVQITDFGGTDDAAIALALQNDGKIIVAGNAGSRLAIARYNTDGNPDNTFDGDGLLTVDFGFAYNVTSVALQADGKILVGGTSALARYNSNGTIDLSFAANGILSAPFNNGSSFSCTAVAVQSDGKIVITNDISIIARYNIDGTKDLTYGTNGESYIIDDNGSPNFHGKSITVHNGQIVAGGSDSYFEKSGQGSLFAVVGDGNFGAVYTSPAYFNFGTSLVIQNDNKVILAGYSNNGSNNNFTIVRYNSNGSLDTTFGTAGIEITEASTANNAIAGIALANDKLYAVGYGQYPDNFGVITRYLLAEGGPLPVSLLDLTGVLQNNSVLLKWKISTTKDLASFLIERSADGNRFVPINKVTSNGISTSTQYYSITDGQPLQGINFYRLKLLDVDGKFTYSNIVAVRINAGNKLQIYPNPAKTILYVEASGANENAIVQIVDGIGRKLKEMTVSLNGKTSFTVDVASLSTGTYHLILHKKEKTEVQTFIKR